MSGNKSFEAGIGKFTITFSHIILALMSGIFRITKMNLETISNLKRFAPTKCKNCGHKTENRELIKLKKAILACEREGDDLNAKPLAILEAGSLKAAYQELLKHKFLTSDSEIIAQLGNELTKTIDLRNTIQHGLLISDPNHPEHGINCRIEAKEGNGFYPCESQEVAVIDLEKENARLKELMYVLFVVDTCIATSKPLANYLRIEKNIILRKDTAKKLRRQLVSYFHDEKFSQQKSPSEQ